MSIMDLKKNAPKGEFLAYINKEEAAMLKKAGGSGKLVNGIPSFRPEDYGQEARSKEKGFDQSDTSNPYSNASQNKQAAENKAIANRHKERVEKIARHDYGPKKNIFQKIAAYDKRYKNAWAAKQKQKQLTAIDKMIAKNYVANPHMDIDEIRDALMSQYDGTTNTMKGLEGFNTGKLGMNYGPTQLGPLGLNTKNVKGEPLGTKYMDTTPSLYSHISNSKVPSFAGAILGKVSPPNINNLMSGFNRINQLTDIQKDGVTQNEITDYYDRAQGKGKYDIFGGGGDGDGPQPYLPINYNTGAATTEAVEPYTNDFTYRMGDQDVIYENYGTPGYRTTAAEGGVMGTRARRAFGGIMDRVDKRQQFFLGGIGKAIGKVAKAAGKVLSSDVGKMALAGAAIYYGGGGRMPFTKAFNATKGGGFGGFKAFGEGSFFSKSNPLLFSEGRFSPFKFSGLTTAIGAMGGPAKVDQMPGDGNRGGHLTDSKGNEGQQAIKDEVREAYASGDSDRINEIQKYYTTLPGLNAVRLPDSNPYLPFGLYGSDGYRTTVATGGRIGKAEGGLMDLGGMEKDYRAEGGFVPIGEYEKKDDVPARLSVNEFVFTADAVRGAGQGDIDKGAEIMENMMENLENGGTVSEESQGNKGAQNMFKTSERLGAVI